MNNKKTLLEKGIPVHLISPWAEREKKGGAKPRISEMHYYWTRKPLITARTAVLGAILSEDFSTDKFLELLGIGKNPVKKPFTRNYSENEYKLIADEIKKTHNTSTDNLKILDPFAGSGHIPLEILRANLNVSAVDINPVAWIVQNATLKIPLQNTSKFLTIAKSFFNELSMALENKTNEYFITSKKGESILGYFYSWIVTCPDCKKVIPLINNWGLGGKRTDKEKYYLDYKIIDEKIIFHINRGLPKDFPQPSVIRGKGKCIYCSNTIKNSIILEEIKKYKKTWLIAVAYRTDNTIGADFRLPTHKELQYQSKKQSIPEELIELIPTQRMPEAVVMSEKYLETWDKLFTTRQLIYLSSIIKFCNNWLMKHAEKYNKTILESLALASACLLAKIIDYNSRLCAWNYRQNTLSHLTAYRGYGLLWNHFEVHPFEGASGSLSQSIKSVLAGLEEVFSFLSNKAVEIELKNQSMLSLSSETNATKYNLIITDPPYFDDVAYPELSEVFYVWQRILLKDIFVSESIFNEVIPPRQEDLSSNRSDRDDEFVKIGMEHAFQKMHELLSDDGLLVLFYAHSKLEAWEFVLNGLVNAGFKITSTYPLITESLNSILAMGKSSIFSSILLTARKRTEEKKGILEDLEDEIREYLMPKLDEFWKLGLRHSDFTGSAIGPVLEVITSYSSLRSRTGKIDVIYLLELASKYVIQFILTKYLGRSDVDSTTAFFLYISLEQEEAVKDLRIPFDNAHILSKSMHIDLKLMEKNGLIDDGGTGKKKNRVIRILGSTKRLVLEGDTLIDQIHRAMRAFELKGITGMQNQLKNDNLSEKRVKPVLELIARCPQAPHTDYELANKMLGLRADLKKAKKTLDDFGIK